MRAALGLAFAAQLLAHTLYVFPDQFRLGRGQRRLAIALHNGDAFPASEDAVTLDRLRDVRLISETGETPITGWHRTARATRASIVAPPPGSHWLVARTNPRTLSLPPAKFEAYLKEEGLDWAIEWRARHGESARPSRERYTKFAKSLIVCQSPGVIWSRQVGLDLEFVPEGDPASLRPGDTLSVLLLWKGKPAAGVRVEKAWVAAAGKHGTAAVGRADSEGRVRVKLERSGRWRLHAVAMERLEGDPEADWSSDWATLTFELP